MKKLLTVAVILGAAMVSCNSMKSIKNYTDKDSLAYAFGTIYGADMRRNDSTFNTAIFAVAFQDAFQDKSEMTPEQADAFLREWFYVREPARRAKLAEAEIGEAQKWLDDVKAKNPNVQTTESGLMYEILDLGDETLKAVENADKVQVSYKGSLRDGTVFDENADATFYLGQVIAGWTEGMKLVGKGGKITLWIPATLGYGANGAGKIPGNAALKFEVTILDVIPATPAETTEETPAK
jgi:FKBP-type peptidyl-prolyl cis-trans isomerase